MPLCMLKFHFYTQQYSDQVTITLELNSAHIIYYYMDAAWSVDLTQIYFAHPDCFILQNWIHATCLYLHTINQTGPHIYCYILSKGLDYMPLGILCECIVATVNYFNAT